MKCLTQGLSRQECKNIYNFSKEKCEHIAKTANLNIPFTDKEPGKQLIQYLDRLCYSVPKLKRLLRESYPFFKPKCKVAILIANEKYQSMPKLVTPASDCNLFQSLLIKLGFITVVVLNSTSEELKTVLHNVYNEIPESSYVLIYYAGHGCELLNRSCILSIDCPKENITLEHCITENDIVQGLRKCKTELGIVILDMCRYQLERESNPEIYAQISSVDICTINENENLIIAFASQCSEAAFEQIELYTMRSINDSTYELKTEDEGKIKPMSSQYFKTLSTRIKEDLDISNLFDQVNEDMNKLPKTQNPVTKQGTLNMKYSLCDPTSGDMKEILSKLQVSLKECKSCSVVAVNNK